MRYRFLLLVAILLGLAGFSEVSNGQPLIITGDTNRIDPKQGAYIEEVIPGDEREYPIEVTNPSEEVVTALLYAADAIPGIGGGSDFTLPTDPDLGSAAWYTTPDQTIRLQPGETKRFLMNMRIPEHVQPGQYVSVIGVFIDPRQSATNGQDQVMTTPAYKVGVQVMLNDRLAEAKPPEAIPHAATYALDNGKTLLSILLINEGASLSTPQMEVSIVRQEDQQQMLAWEDVVDSIYAGTAAQVQKILEQPLPQGSYLAEVKTIVNGQTVRKVLPFDVEQSNRLTEQQIAEREFIEEERRFLKSRLYLYSVILLIIITLTLYQKKKGKK